MDTKPKFICKGTFAECVYLSEAPFSTITPGPPPYTMYTCILYIYSHREGGGGGEDEPGRREKK
jgi:hypothetical protein